MCNQVKLIKNESIASKERWGTCRVTITADILESLKNGETLLIDVMEEYSVLISVSEEVSYKEEF